MTSNPPMPVEEHYRGVKVHALQPRERIASIVKPEIDQVFMMTDASDLAEYAGDARHSPEARLFASARVEALWQLAAEGRAVRPAVNLDRLRASVAGLDSFTWIDPWRYGALLDREPGVERERPLALERQQA